MQEAGNRKRLKRGTASERVLAAATRLLIEGQGHLEIDQLAKAAGCSTGAIYHNFRNKAGVLSAVVGRYNESVGRLIAPPAVPDDRRVWLMALREAVEATSTFMWREPLTRVIVQETIKDAGAAAQAERWLGRHIATLAAHFAEAQAKGYLPADCDPEVFAAGVAGGVRQIMRVLFARSEPQSPEAGHRAVWAFVSRQLG